MKVPYVSLSVASALIIAGFSSLLQARPEVGTQSIVNKQPSIVFDQATGEYFTTLSVLTYNIAGLPWPVKQDREAALTDIKEVLQAMQYAGTAPDIVLVQEAFTEQGFDIGREAGYSYIAKGPLADTDAESLSGSEYQDFLDERTYEKGELSGKMVGSGLVAFSNYPIIEQTAKPFRDSACGGYDCLANKGMLLVRVAVPGVPLPLDILTTHLNSRGASGVSAERSLFAHKLQVDDLVGFIKENQNPRYPFLMAGDFNFRGGNERLQYLTSKLTYTFTREYCEGVSQCQADTIPWENHQDHQTFADTPIVRIVPIAAEEVFDTPVKGRVLSDHNGYLVVYRISWRK